MLLVEQNANLALEAFAEGVCAGDGADHHARGVGGTGQGSRVKEAYLGSRKILELPVFQEILI